MAENMERKIRNLEALALRPGTPHEGELAKNRAIELAAKHHVRSVFTDPIPKTASKPKVKKLHHMVVQLDAELRKHGWVFVGFTFGKRVYEYVLNEGSSFRVPYSKQRSRTTEIVYMLAHGYDNFSCEHYNTQTGRHTPIGKTPSELNQFFESAIYKLQLWPQNITKEDEFYKWEWEPELQSIPEDPEGEPVERTSVIDEMLDGKKVFKRRKF